MTRARLRVLIFAVAALAAAAAVALVLHPGRRDTIEARPAAQRPVLLLLTSLPLIFSEDFSLRGGGSPALKALQTRYRIVPISVTDPADLGKGRLLLMAHPLAQPAEDLVALDDWVRRGGRVLLLADPLLEWPSARPLGDPLRPPPMFMDTGLLAHWGLRLEGPWIPGKAKYSVNGYPVEAISAGELHAMRPGCRIANEALIARCQIGRGEVTVIADADFLNVDEPDAARSNLDALLVELAALERK
jgi:hypothetical protein